jgi:hypothetical protein
MVVAAEVVAGVTGMVGAGDWVFSGRNVGGAVMDGWVFNAQCVGQFEVEGSSKVT